MEKSRMGKGKWFLLDCLALIILVALDQLSKALAVQKLMGQSPFVLIDGVFELHYLENRGAAFGMLQNATLFFIVAAAVMFCGIVYVMLQLPNEKKYHIWHLFAVLLTAGGIGNVIDRLAHNYVVDFLYFKLINFPIFNVADMYVTVGTFLLIFHVIFFCKEEDLEFLVPGKKSKG